MPYLCKQGMIGESSKRCEDNELCVRNNENIAVCIKDELYPTIKDLFDKPPIPAQIEVCSSADYGTFLQRHTGVDNIVYKNTGCESLNPLICRGRNSRTGYTDTFMVKVTNDDVDLLTQDNVCMTTFNFIQSLELASLSQSQP